MTISSSTTRYEHQLLNAIDCIHAAGSGDMAWSLALESVCDFVGARAADLNKFDPDTLDYVGFHPAHVDPFVLRYISDFMGDPLNENPRLTQLYMPMAQGTIMADSDFWTPRQLNAMPFFADFLQPWGTFDSLNTWVRRGADGSPWVALAVHFKKEDCPPQAEERRRLAVLLPHIRRACGTEERLGTALQSHSQLQSALDQVADAVILLSASGHVVSANRAAHAVIREGDGISVTLGNLLRLGDSAANNALEAALFRCRSPATILSADDDTPIDRIVVQRRGKAPIVIRVQPLPLVQRHRSSAVAVLFVHRPAPVDSDQLWSVCASFGLTSAEAKLVRALADGHSLKQIADHQGRSYETLRCHLRRVFEKTGTNRQGALLHLVRSGG